MKILYVSQYFPPEMGAPAARAYEFARRWVSFGHDVTVLTTFPNHPTGVIHDGYRGRRFLRERPEGIKVVRTFIYAAPNRGILRRSLNYLSFMLSATTQGAWATDRPDLIIATSPQFLCAMAGYFLSRLKRRPFVFEVRDLWPDSIVAVGALPEGHWGVRILRRLERFLYRNSDVIVIVSEAFRPEIVLRGGRTEKIHVVTNGADVGLFRPPADNEKLKRSFGLEGKFVASFAGTLGMAHGLDTVLQAAARLSSSTDIVFWLVGEGARKEELKRAAEARGLTNVLFQGQVPRERVPDVLGASDVSLVLLRKTDLFRTVIPSKMFEAMAVARPIIRLRLRRTGGSCPSAEAGPPSGGASRQERPGLRPALPFPRCAGASLPGGPGVRQSWSSLISYRRASGSRPSA